MNSKRQDPTKQKIQPTEARMATANNTAKSNSVQKSKSGREPLAHAIIRLIEDSKAMLFYDQYNDTYIAYDGDGSNVSKINSKDSKLLVASLSYSQLGSPITSDASNRVLLTLAAKARFEGKLYPLEVRSVRRDDGLWYDLGSSAVHITETGWRVTDQPPIIFKRFPHQKPQVVPARGGDIRALLKYVNITSKAEQVLFIVYVVAAFIPEFPHPLLILHGAQGAGKTTPMKLMKELIDPSVIGGLSAPKNLEGFVQTASHHSFLFFDNLSKMPEWFSDALARAATGDSFSKRELYSNDDDVFYRFQKTIALNGINQVVYKPDLLDRSILLNLVRIAPDKRKEAQVFWAEFEADRAAILGAILDVLSSAMAIYPTVKLAKLPRMADFTRWGYAIAEAAGFGGEAFIHAYNANIALQHDEAIEANPVAKAIVEFVKSKPDWEGTPAELYSLLGTSAFKLGISQSSGWPRDAARFGRALTPIVPNLNAAGIDLERSRSKDRLVTIRKITVDTDAIDVTDGKLTDSDDGTTVPTVK
jgi:hypothetical protein